jgi:hypothetical protein
VISLDFTQQIKNLRPIRSKRNADYAESAQIVLLIRFFMGSIILSGRKKEYIIDTLWMHLGGNFLPFKPDK